MFNERSGIQGGESNTGPPEYEAGGLTTQERRLVHRREQNQPNIIPSIHDVTTHMTTQIFQDVSFHGIFKLKFYKHCSDILTENLNTLPYTYLQNKLHKITHTCSLFLMK
jgi:hypothetical protein